MTINATLSRDQFVRLSLLRHFQRTSFYFYALTCAALTSYTFFGGPVPLMIVGWVPFGIYILMGLANALTGSIGKNRPYLQPTRYEFTDQGVAIKNAQGESQLEWQHFASWQMLSDCYVLVLTAGSIIAIPRSAIPPHQSKQFEQILQQHIP